MYIGSSLVVIFLCGVSVSSQRWIKLMAGLGGRGKKKDSWVCGEGGGSFFSVEPHVIYWWWYRGYVPLKC